MTKYIVLGSTLFGHCMYCEYALREGNVLVVQDNILNGQLKIDTSVSLVKTEYCMQRQFGLRSCMFENSD